MGKAVSQQQTFAEHNLLAAAKYATILKVSKYSRKLLRSLYVAPEELLALDDLGAFFLKVSELLAAEQSAVAKLFKDFLELHEDFADDYQILYKQDPLYPNLLRETDKPPFFLFCQGELDLFQKKGIAVVGTREPSGLGIKRAQKLAMLLSASGFVVVSGLAKGIDTAAHTGAIKAGGKTIAVIGTPLDKYYPKESKRLQEIIAHSHLLVSQFHLGHPVTRANFPTRNYTMSGVSLATVIIEASETSGALIQARQCMAQKRHLFILRNLLENKDLKWPKRFVEQGAFVIKEIEDVMAHLESMPEYKINSNQSNHSLFL